MALAVLLAVFALIIILIALFIFPPTTWVKQMEAPKGGKTPGATPAKPAEQTEPEKPTPPNS
jgi:hypothetical protein